MISLKSFSLVLADQLDMSAVAIYERQRALIRMGLLEGGGRGRNNGLAATPETVAMLLIAIMVTDNLSDTDDRVHRLASANYYALHGPGGCRLTKEMNFHSALTKIFWSPALASRVNIVRVSRDELNARVNFNTGRSSSTGTFFTASSTFGREAQFPRNMSVEARFRGKVFGEIALALAQDRTKE